MALCSTWVWAQLPVYTCDFEDPVENRKWLLNAKNSMVLMELENKWWIGEAGDFSEKGNYGIFISREDNQIDPVYNSSNTMFVTAVREIKDLPAGKYRLYFDWRCGGKKGTSEGLYVCWVPSTQNTNSAPRSGDLPMWAKDYRCGDVFSGKIDWSVGQVDIEHDGADHKLVLLWFNTQGEMVLPSACVDNLELRPLSSTGEPACSTVQNVTHIIQGDSVILSWEGDAKYYDLRCYDYVNDAWFMRQGITEKSCTIPGVSEGVHSFIIRAHCSDTTASDFVQYTQLIYHKGIRCIEYLDLKGKCFTGAYTKRAPNVRPFTKQEQVDLGYDNMDSRHTLHFMPDEYDANTNYQLRTIPDGYLASVRLGDIGVGGSLGQGNGTGEAIEYKYKVENDASSILKIKYAVVLSNPHPETPEQNPQFWLDIWCDGKPIANDCGFAFFTSGDSDDSGWKEGAEASGSSPAWLYKDWTEHAINLRDYVGKVLTIRLVTTDCELSGHTGYVYFVLDCEDGGMSGLNCGEDNPTTHFTAPSGFDYAWYKEMDPANILSSEQEFYIPPMDTNIYCVNVINKNNPNCWYTLTAMGWPRIPTPLALYSTSVENCQNVVTFENYSCVSVKNEVTGKITATNEPVTSIMWDFGDGVVEASSPAIGAQVQHIFPPEGGDFKVILTAGISGDICTLSDTILLTLPDLTLPVTEIVEHICRPDYPHGFNYEGVWFKEDVDTTFTLVSQLTGCDSLCHLQLFFHDTELTTLVDTICEGDTIVLLDNMLTESGQYVDTTTTFFGCDSIIQLQLYVEPRLQVLLQDSLFVCPDEQRMEFSYEILQGNMDSIIFSFDSVAYAVGFASRYAFAPTQEAIISLPDSIVPNFYTVVVSYAHSFCETPTDTLLFELAYPSSVAIVKSDILAVQNQDYNGGYIFDSIQWYRDEELIPGAIGPNLAVDAEDVGHSFTVKLTRAGEQVAIGSCPIVYLPTALENLYWVDDTTLLEVYNILGLYVGQMNKSDINKLSTGIYLLSDGKKAVKIIL